MSRGRNYKRDPDFTLSLRIDEPIDRRHERVRLYAFRFNAVSGKTAEQISQDIFDAIFDRKAESTDIVVACLFRDRQILKEYKKIKEVTEAVPVEASTT